jgi:hypothetical protein
MTKSEKFRKAIRNGWYLTEKLSVQQLEMLLIQVRAYGHYYISVAFNLPLIHLQLDGSFLCCIQRGMMFIALSRDNLPCFLQDFTFDEVIEFIKYEYEKIQTKADNGPKDNQEVDD